MLTLGDRIPEFDSWGFDRSFSSAPTPSTEPVRSSALAGCFRKRQIWLRLNQSFRIRFRTRSAAIAASAGDIRRLHEAEYSAVRMSEKGVSSSACGSPLIVIHGFSPELRATNDAPVVCME
jgi:hypothetical protein